MSRQMSTLPDGSYMVITASKGNAECELRLWASKAAYLNDDEPLFESASHVSGKERIFRTAQLRSDGLRKNIQFNIRAMP